MTQQLAMRVAKIMARHGIESGFTLNNGGTWNVWAQEAQVWWSINALWQVNIVLAEVRWMRGD